MSECCRASSVGSDKKLFDDLKSVLERLSSRPSDVIMMDASVSTKASVYRNLVLEAKRVASLLGVE